MRFDRSIKKSGRAHRSASSAAKASAGRTGQTHRQRSGQALIFLMVVVLIGLLVVIWNFDLHRVITAKVRVRNSTDAAALAAARWQGVTLNMIGELNLIQAAVLSLAYENDDTDRRVFEVPAEINTLHELRARLAFIGPLAAYSIAQQTAFENGAFHDPALAADVRFLAEEIRNQQGAPPYDNAFDDYAELLELLAGNGMAVGSFTPRLPAHPLTEEKFYGAIAQALADWWCPMHDFEYELENYEGIDSWTKLDTELDYNYIFDLNLFEFTSVAVGNTAFLPAVTSFTTIREYKNALSNYLAIAEETGTVPNFGSAEFAGEAFYPSDPSQDIRWHAYDPSWARGWPSPTYYDEESDEEGGQFPLRSAIRPEYNYLGAVAGLSISTPVGRGILSTTDNETVDLVYKASAMPFGSLESDSGTETPYYLGIVFPAFEDVRLIHSDIGGRVLEPAFYRHVAGHLAAYLERGPKATDPDCRYCKLLRAWETLDRESGLAWLKKAYDDDGNNPCEPDDDQDRPWGKAGGGATGGS